MPDERWNRPLRRGALALLLLFQLALVQVMAASPSVHRDLHDHDHGPGHHPPEPPCAVDLWMASGGGELPTPVVAPVPDEAPPPPAASVILRLDPFLAPTHLTGGIAAHSPPRAP